MHETLAGLYGWYWGILLAAAGVGAVVAMLRRARSVEPAASVLRTDAGAVGGLAVCAAVVIFTALGMIYHAVLSHAVFGRPMTNPWYFMTALPFLFVLLVRGLEAINRRLATAAAAALAVLFVAIDLHGTWVQMPTVLREHHGCGPPVVAPHGDSSRDPERRPAVVVPGDAARRALPRRRRAGVRIAKSSDRELIRGRVISRVRFRDVVSRLARSEHGTSAERWPRITQIHAKGNPPDQVVRDAQQESRWWPRASRDQPEHSDRAQDFSGEANGRRQPTVFRNARDVEIEDSVKADDHAKTREYCRVIGQRHAGQPE